MSDEEAVDWRECELCRDWKGKPPIRLEEVRNEFTPELGFRVSHGCYFYRDSQGETQFIPTTIAESDEVRYQWFPELPEGGLSGHSM